MKGEKIDTKKIDTKIRYANERLNLNSENSEDRSVDGHMKWVSDIEMQEERHVDQPCYVDHNCNLHHEQPAATWLCDTLKY